MRNAICIAMAVMGALAGAAAGAEEAFPSHTVKLVVPGASGSTTDTLARIMADQLSRTWAKPVVVENITGGGTVVGATQVFRSPPDGYTLMVSPPPPVTTNHLLYRKLAYDPQQFVPVALLAKIPNAMAVRKDIPAANLAGFIAYAKANPGTVTFGSQGAGTTAHLSASQLEMLAGISMVHVPYRGAVPALNDVIAGHIDMFFDTVAGATPMYRDGKLKILAVGSAERSRAVPEVPALGEVLPGFRSVTWFAIVAPPGMATALVVRINRDVEDALKDPAVAERLDRLTLEPMIGTPVDAAKFVADERRLWGKVIADAHITAD